MEQPQTLVAVDEREIQEQLDAIQASLARIEAHLAPIVVFFEQIKNHPMLRGILG